MVFTQNEGEGGAVFKFVTCMWILLFLNNRSIVLFVNGGGRGVTKLAIFCGRDKYMTPNFKFVSKFLRVVMHWFVEQ